MKDINGKIKELNEVVVTLQNLCNEKCEIIADAIYELQRLKRINADISFNPVVIEEISLLWFNSELRCSRPNLAIQATIQANKLSFIVGIYSFNSVTGISKIDPIFPAMDYKKAKEIIK